MANYIFSYDLNGKRPTHEEMDEHIKASDWDTGRILETVWYIGGSVTSAQVTDYVASILSSNDGYAIVTADFMQFENLLVAAPSLLAAWQRNS